MNGASSGTERSVFPQKSEKMRPGRLVSDVHGAVSAHQCHVPPFAASRQFTLFVQDAPLASPPPVAVTVPPATGLIVIVNACVQNVPFGNPAQRVNVNDGVLTETVNGSAGTIVVVPGAK